MAAEAATINHQLRNWRLHRAQQTLPQWAIGGCVYFPGNTQKRLIAIKSPSAVSHH
jgi:hypothetical protein